ncbi:MAG: hypothetical protein LQ341_000073 [Variospora aurantia]|nr:MAG: hypothetical protein LQ341_000073 [Variospora aurantia]
MDGAASLSTRDLREGLPAGGCGQEAGNEVVRNVDVGEGMMKQESRNLKLEASGHAPSARDGEG